MWIVRLRTALSYSLKLKIQNTGGESIDLQDAALRTQEKEYGDSVEGSGVTQLLFGILERSLLCPQCGALGNLFFEQSCISIEIRYNTNKDCFLILYFI